MDTFFIVSVHLCDQEPFNFGPYVDYSDAATMMIDIAPDLLKVMFPNARIRCIRIYEAVPDKEGWSFIDDKSVYMFEG